MLRGKPTNKRPGDAYVSLEHYVIDGDSYDVDHSA